jgi:hypothetical protein
VLTREAAVLVAQHEHVQACGGRVVHEMVCRVGLVGRCAHQKSRARAQ